jgi:glycine cleavage system aminomethyltransferase T
MGYVPPEFSNPGQPLSIEINGEMLSAIVVPTPFYIQKPV